MGKNKRSIILCTEVLFNEIIDRLKGDRPEMKEYFLKFYNLYIKNVVNVANTYGYSYIPNDTYKLTDSNIFGLNITAQDTTPFLSPNDDRMPEVDRKVTNSVTNSNTEFYQPIWACDNIYKSRKYKLFLFDGTHRFLSLLDKQENGIEIPKTLMLIVDKRSNTIPVELFIPYKIYENLDDTIASVGGSYDTLMSFNINGCRIYKIRVTGLELIRLIITAISMVMDYNYNFMKRHNCLVVNPSDIIHNSDYFDKKGNT